ncbi:MAG: acetyl-CoA C-acyltransferase [Ramlibacter sp.]
MSDAFICDAVRTPIGRYGGALATVRADDLAAIPIRALIARHPGLADGGVDDVILGCANQAGEDNRNVARMAALLAGLGERAPGVTVNRLCGSGLDAVGTAARAVRAGEASLLIAGGVESMSRAPFVMAKADAPFARSLEVHDTTIGWRFVNSTMAAGWGVDPMPATAEAVADAHGIDRAAQDALALASQQKAAAAQDAGKFKDEIVAVTIPQKKGDPIVFDTDEYVNRKTNAEALAGLRPAFDKAGSVTAGNASGLNDGAAAVVVMSARKAKELGLEPLATIRAFGTSGLDPKTMGMGPVPATKKALKRAGWKASDVNLFELNEAFAAQACAVNKALDIDPAKVNVNGGAIAIGHPIGASGARILVTLLHEMRRREAKKGIAALCIGGGMGVSLAVERA